MFGIHLFNQIYIHSRKLDVELTIILTRENNHNYNTRENNNRYQKKKKKLARASDSGGMWDSLSRSLLELAEECEPRFLVNDTFIYSVESLELEQQN